MPRQDRNKNTCRFGNVVLGQVTLSWWGSHRLDCTMSVICTHKLIYNCGSHAKGDSHSKLRNFEIQIENFRKKITLQQKRS